jgi:hypothetical protein
MMMLLFAFVTLILTQDFFFINMPIILLCMIKVRHKTGLSIQQIKDSLKFSHAGYNMFNANLNYLLVYII